MPFSPSLSDIFDKEFKTFRLVALGSTRNLNSLSLSVGRSSNASNSVPSPYVLCRLGRRNTLGAVDGATEGIWVRGTPFRSEAVDGGRGGNGEVARCTGGWLTEVAEGPGNTEAREGLDFTRIEVGMVRRNAAGLEEGVDGRVGGTVKSSA